MCIFDLYKLHGKRYEVCRFGGIIPRASSAAIKNACLLTLHWCYEVLFPDFHWQIHTLLHLLITYVYSPSWERASSLVARKIMPWCACVILKTSEETLWIFYLTCSLTCYLFISLLESITYISQFEMERKQSEFISQSNAQIVGSTLHKSWEFSGLHVTLAQVLYL